MSGEKDGGGSTVTTEQHEAALASARAEAQANGEKSGRAAGEKAAAERIGAILGCEEATGRESLARHLAFNTDMSAESAKATLAASALAPAPKTPSNGLDALMDGNPKVGGDATAGNGGGDKDEEEISKAVASVVAYLPNSQRK